MMMRRRHMMMHMTFFWGKDAEILFDGWPGYDHLGMYILALAVVFLLAVVTEWLSHCSILRRHSAAAAAAQTVMYAVRIGLAYLVMLAVMSFNAGVFLAAVAGHGVGFFLFGSRAFKNPPAAVGVGGKTASDLPPMNCC
ncbi:copper transporter 6 [Phtheirospermum japonicum]|uniref:Copper transport protein n=1 Tax=Phtheirospermum japonicum TaxID=374723 RepID=A0A830AXX7_9LAMI|nr:copper transporter 6 [Phtheirospermum japonicum]